MLVGRVVQWCDRAGPQPLGARPAESTADRPVPPREALMGLLKAFFAAGTDQAYALYLRAGVAGALGRLIRGALLAELRPCPARPEEPPAPAQPQKTPFKEEPVGPTDGHTDLAQALLLLGGLQVYCVFRGRLEELLGEAGLAAALVETILRPNTDFNRLTFTQRMASWLLVQSFLLPRGFDPQGTALRLAEGTPPDRFWAALEPNGGGKPTLALGLPGRVAGPLGAGFLAHLRRMPAALQEESCAQMLELWAQTRMAQPPADRGRAYMETLRRKLAAPGAPSAAHRTADPAPPPAAPAAAATVAAALLSPGREAPPHTAAPPAAPASAPGPVGPGDRVLASGNAPVPTPENASALSGPAPGADGGGTRPPMTIARPTPCRPAPTGPYHKERPQPMATFAPAPPAPRSSGGPAQAAAPPRGLDPAPDADAAAPVPSVPAASPARTHPPTAGAGPLHRCSICKRDAYCSVTCQRADWARHKTAWHTQGQGPAPPPPAAR
ncbi:hypothetical protein PAPYR_3054 [Paratrimastix pyriformis]|uniref:MYND-type domain-containing protein n=1 Tax=Paratrimastix pyriformis TaxID=342808 RepID=A0ABQ8UNP4_9EUKA|nr:hypothetical protein PAPYR_3054 [Paratrimastix pyriformis]